MTGESSFNTDRRTVLKAGGAGLAATSLGGFGGCLGDGGDDEYPSQEITITVPFSSGGGFDAYARITEPYWEEQLDADVVVENVTGGGGVTGTTQVYNAEPDGYSMMIIDVYQAITQQVGRDVDYDVLEMSHVGMLTQAPNAMIAMESSDIEDFDDLVGRIDEFNFATQGVGSGAHTMTVLLGAITGEFTVDDLTFVHYDGTGEALAGLERGEADVFTVSAVTSAVSVVQALEEAFMFTVFSSEDDIGWFLDEEDVETTHYSAELDVSGIDDYADLTVFRRFFTGPPGVPDDVLDGQREAFDAFVSTDEFQDEADENGRPIIDPDDAAAVETYLAETGDTFGSEPYSSMFEETFE